MPTQQKWEADIKNLLRGKTIKTVRYMSEEEAAEYDWHSRPLAIFFTDGTFIFPMMDDEGNNGGALATSDEKLPVIPVM